MWCAVLSHQGSCQRRDGRLLLCYGLLSALGSWLSDLKTWMLSQGLQNSWPSLHQSTSRWPVTTGLEHASFPGEILDLGQRLTKSENQILVGGPSLC